MKYSKTFFCEQLRKALYEKRLTQKDLAEKIGVNRPVVNRWITGNSNPSFNSLKKIAAALELPLNYFSEDYNINTELYNESNNTEKDFSKIVLLEEKIKRLEAEIMLTRKDNELLKKEIEILNDKFKFLGKALGKK